MTIGNNYDIYTSIVFNFKTGEIDIKFSFERFNNYKRFKGVLTKEELSELEPLRQELKDKEKEKEEQKKKRIKDLLKK